MSISENFIFCPPPSGKPNPELPLSEGVMRPRITQAAQKGETCWYYAMNMLRLRIGKVATAEQLQMRTLEKRFSTLRKEHTACDENYYKQKVAYEALCEYLGTELIDKSKAESYLDAYRTGENAISQANLESTYLDLLPGITTDSIKLTLSFLKQDKYKDLETFIRCNYYEKHIKIDEKFVMSYLNTTLERLYEADPVRDLDSSAIEWKKLSVQNRSWFLDNKRFELAYKSYGLSISPWHPNQPLKSLFEALRKFGPHIVKGNFGQLFYKEVPFKLKATIAERSIFGWKPGSERRPVVSDTHVVILVGVDLDKKLIYFLDPSDSSKPENKSQKVYVMSHEKFKEYLWDLTAVHYKFGIFPDKPYALYNPLHPSNYA